MLDVIPECHKFLSLFLTLTRSERNSRVETSITPIRRPGKMRESTRRCTSLAVRLFLRICYLESIDQAIGFTAKYWKKYLLKIRNRNSMLVESWTCSFDSLRLSSHERQTTVVRTTSYLALNAESRARICEPPSNASLRPGYRRARAATDSTTRWSERGVGAGIARMKNLFWTRMKFVGPRRERIALSSDLLVSKRQSRKFQRERKEKKRKPTHPPPFPHDATRARG